MVDVSEFENEKVETNVLLETQEMEKGDLETLKGDSIGDTVYSGKWIINILFSISKVEEDGWTEKLENELCTLWDMTTEKDIVQFLMENDFFKISECVLCWSQEPRLTEIILGILGNMTCEPSVLEALGANEEILQVILLHLSSEDSATLVQVLRLLRSAIWNIQTQPESKWRSILTESVVLKEVVPFILKSSTNEELLIATTSFLRTCAEISFPSGETLLNQLFGSSSLLYGMLESFGEVLPQDEGHYSSAFFRYLEDWLELFTNVRKGSQIYQEILQEDNLTRLVEIPRRILTNSVDPWNLYPLDENKASCVHRCVEIILDFRCKGLLTADSVADIDGAILKIIVSIGTAMGDEDPEGTMQELLKYLESYWIEESKMSNTDEIAKILRANEKSVIDYAISLLKSKIPVEKINSIINGLPNK